MKKDRFQASYHIDDGYASSSDRKHTYTFYAPFVARMDEEEARSFFWESIEEDSIHRFRPISTQEGEFMEWFKSIKESQP